MHPRGLHHRGHIDLTVLDEARFRGGAAHVERNDAALSGNIAEQRARKPPARRPRLQKPDREFARGRGRDEAACRMHQPQRAAEAARGEFAFEIRQIAIHQWLHVSVRAGRDRARILAQLGDHFAGKRNE